MTNVKINDNINESLIISKTIKIVIYYIQQMNIIYLNQINMMNL